MHVGRSADLFEFSGLLLYFILSGRRSSLTRATILAATVLLLGAAILLMLPTNAIANDPSVSLSGPTYTLGGHPFVVDITFSVSVTGFEQSDVTVGNASVMAFSGSGRSYEITLHPSASGVVTVDVAANVANDIAGNGNTAATRYSATADLDPPSVDITGPSVAQTGAFNVNIAFSEPVGVYSHPFERGDVTVGNGSVTGFSGSGASYSIAITPSASGTVTVDVAAGVARDAGGNANTAASQFSVQVTLNSPPQITLPGNQTYEQGETITAIDFKVTDVDGDEVTTTVSGLPSGLAYTNSLVQGTVSASATTQDYSVTVSASDGVNAAVSGTFTITVTEPAPPANRPPEITVPGDKTYEQGETITAIDFKVTDEDGDEVTTTVSGLPSGLSYTNSLVQGTVSSSATAQDYTVTVSANDGVNAAVTGSFTITVTEPATTPPANSPPQISVPGDKTYEQGQTITAIDFKVTDEDGDEVTTTVSGLPSGLSYTNSMVQGTVSSSAAAKDYTVTVSANDGVNAAVTGTFTITVTTPAPPANRPPEITVPGDKTYEQGETITAIDFKVTDEDGDEVTTTVSGLPSGLSYTNSLLQGTVSSSAATQDYTVTVSAG